MSTRIVEPRDERRESIARELLTEIVRKVYQPGMPEDEIDRLPSIAARLADGLIAELEKPPSHARTLVRINGPGAGNAEGLSNADEAAQEDPIRTGGDL